MYARHEFDVPDDVARRLYGDTSVLRPADAGGQGRSWCGAACASARPSTGSGLCKVPALTLINRYDLELEAELTQAVTGLPVSAADLVPGRRTHRQSRAALRPALRGDRRGRHAAGALHARNRCRTGRAPGAPSISGRCVTSSTRSWAGGRTACLPRPNWPNSALRRDCEREREHPGRPPDVSE